MKPPRFDGIGRHGVGADDQQIAAEQPAPVRFAQDGTDGTGQHRNAKRTAEPGRLVQVLPARLAARLGLTIGSKLRLVVLRPRPKAPAVAGAIMDLVEVAAATNVLASQSVPWARNWAPPTFFASTSNTSMNSAPIVLREHDGLCIELASGGPGST